jgi:phosphomevalonate kinase
VKARAPGKVVISGAYAVLTGAPAIVSAVSRYVLADSERAAQKATPEVAAAFGDSVLAPWFDASELRSEGEKLGLGSSAAILVASLAARELERSPQNDDELARRIFEPALRAHRHAQGGGSGIDVLASTYGGTLVARRSAEGLDFLRGSLPADLVIEVWAAGVPATTSALVGAVERLARENPSVFARVNAVLTEAAERAVSAMDDGDGFIRALEAQASGLLSLGEAAGVPIVTPSIVELGTAARSQGAVVLPAGAGGGDVALYVGRGAPTPALVEQRDALGHTLLSLTLGARGVHDATSFG